MILRRSLQDVSPAREERTRPAWIAASRIIWHPRASQAAGTVSQTSAESSSSSRRQWLGTLRMSGHETLPKSATAPISRVIWLFAYCHKQDKKSTIRSIACLFG